MKFRGDLLLVVFGILMVMRPETFARVMMTLISIIEEAYASSGDNQGSTEMPSFQEEMKQFRSQIVDPRQQYHDEFWV